MNSQQNEETKPITKEPGNNEQPEASHTDSIDTTESLGEVEQLIGDLKINKYREDETNVTEDDFDENGDPVFPHDLLGKLDEMVNKAKWIIPVLPKAELEVLMDASIKLAKKGICIFQVDRQF